MMNDVRLTRLCEITHSRIITLLPYGVIREYVLQRHPVDAYVTIVRWYTGFDVTVAMCSYDRFNAWRAAFIDVMEAFKIAFREQEQSNPQRGLQEGARLFEDKLINRVKQILKE